jgi:PPOX class probable FMN-dependent enzyme
MGVAMMDYRIRTLDEYRELRGDAHQMNYDKSVGVIDDHIRGFLALCTFLTVASVDEEGRMDVSPKGDPPGFVKVVDDTSIAIPEREGNRRADTFTNILQNPSVAMICFVPGMDETMRINGTARLTTDPELLATMKVKRHTPVLAMLVHVEEAFIHCGKALKRGRL